MKPRRRIIESSMDLPIKKRLPAGPEPQLKPKVPKVVTTVTSVMAVAAQAGQVVIVESETVDAMCTISYFVNGHCLGSEPQGSPTVAIAEKLVVAINQSKHPVKMVSLITGERINKPREVVLSSVEEFLAKSKNEDPSD